MPRLRILISLLLAFALLPASCGGEEVPEIDANYELQERERIDSAIADLDALRADPDQAQIAAAAIGHYLRARDEAGQFNESLGEELGIEEGDELPPGVAPVIADDELLNPAREAGSRIRAGERDRGIRMSRCSDARFTGAIALRR